MGFQRRYKGVEGRCRRAQGYMGLQLRDKGVECISKRVREYMGVQRRYKWVELRVHVEGYGDIWEYKDDTRE